MLIPSAKSPLANSILFSLVVASAASFAASLALFAANFSNMYELVNLISHHYFLAILKSNRVPLNDKVKIVSLMLGKGIFLKVYNFCDGNRKVN